jgi:UDP-N-acetylmuramoyl-L-alanyl-D-glutamate--2,6-diaminopimelate ligase
VQVDDARLALAPAAAFHRHPSKEMQVIGITGTNGKTTTAHCWPRSDAASMTCGILGSGIESAPKHANDANHARGAGCTVAARWPIAAAAPVRWRCHRTRWLRRVDGMTFSAAVFTNLTRDHPISTKTWKRIQAKRRLFRDAPGWGAESDQPDDPRGPRSSRWASSGHLCHQPAGRRDARALSFSLEGLGSATDAAGSLSAQSKLVGGQRPQHPGGRFRRRRSICRLTRSSGIRALEVSGCFELVSSRAR